MLWLLAGILAIGLGGGAALLVGLRGRRVDDHPICRRCGFDLVGQAPRDEAAGNATGKSEGADPPRCSECGADLTRRRAIRCGQRRRRPAVASVGALGLLIALGASGALGWGAATKFDWNTVKPVWLLGRELEHPDPIVAGAATDELRQRLADDRLAPLHDGTRDTRAAERLARSILKYQADTERPWNQGAGEIFERMWQADLLPDELVVQFLAQSLPLEAHIREQVVSGLPLPIRFDVHRRGGGGGLIVAEFTLLDIFIDDERVGGGTFSFLVAEGDVTYGRGSNFPPVESIESNATLSEMHHSPMGMPSAEPPDLTPGARRIRLRLLVSTREFAGAWPVGGGPWSIMRRPVPLPPAPTDASPEEIDASIPRRTAFGQSAWRGPDEQSLIAHELVEIEQIIEVIESTDEAVGLIQATDAARAAAALADTASLEPSRTTAPEAGPLRLHFRTPAAPSASLAYQITMTLPGGEQRDIGWFARDLSGDAQSYPYDFPLGPLDGLGPGDTLRFTFTPSPAAAAHSAGIEEIAGEPFDLELVYPEPPQIINGH